MNHKNYIWSDEFESFMEDIEEERTTTKNQKYIDPWDWEDDFSHREIETFQSEFIKCAILYLRENQLDAEYGFTTSTGAIVVFHKSFKEAYDKEHDFPLDRMFNQAERYLR